MTTPSQKVTSKPTPNSKRNRECITCHQQKSLTDFYKQPNKKDGLFAECKQCAKSRFYRNQRSL